MSAPDRILTRGDDDLLRRVSRSFHITLRVLPGPLRGPLSLAYLLARLSDTVADSARASPARRLIALDSLSAAITGASPPCLPPDITQGTPDPSERELLERANDLTARPARLPPAIRDAMTRTLTTIIAGQRADIERFEMSDDPLPAMPDAASLDQYTHQVAGCVGAFWTELCAILLPGSLARPADALIPESIRFGKALQLVNILRDLPEDLANGRCYLPADALRAQGIPPDTIAHDPSAATPVHREWQTIARDHIMAGGRYTQSLRGRRLRFACRMPLALAQATLDAVGPDAPTRPIRISRTAVRRIALRETMRSILPASPRAD